MSAVNLATLPGLCRCGEVASRPHACEHQPRQLRVCKCGEYTYSATCGPCRRPACPRCMAAAGSPECCTPETLGRQVYVRPCGCVVGGRSERCEHDFAVGSAAMGPRRFR
jgi:hypothetical protein